jgi:hypothetical protein
MEAWMPGLLFYIWFVFATFLTYGCLWLGPALMYGNHPVPVVVAFVVAFWAGTLTLAYGVLRLVALVLSAIMSAITKVGRCTGVW